MALCVVASWALHDIAITKIVWYILKKRRSVKNTILRNCVGDEEGGWGGKIKFIVAPHIIDACTKASK